MTRDELRTKILDLLWDNIRPEARLSDLAAMVNGLIDLADEHAMPRKVNTLFGAPPVTTLPYTPPNPYTVTNVNHSPLKE